MQHRFAVSIPYVLAGSVGLLASSIAMANQPVRLTDTVVTASGFEQKITDAPASISVISNQELQQNRYANLAQALEGVEGVDIRQGTGKTGGLNISIRGMPSEYTLILIDGRRQNAPGNVTPNGFNETSTSFMPPLSAIERIEVIRGPMSTLYGSDAIGGVVNIITKKVAEEWGSTVSVDRVFQENSDYGDSTRTSLYTSGPLVEGVLGLALRGSYYDRDASDLTFDDGSEVSKRGPAPVEGRNFNAGARLNWQANETNDFFVDFERGAQRYENDESQLGTLDVPTGRISGYRDLLRFERNQVAVGHTGRYDFGVWTTSFTHNTTETKGRTIPGNNRGGDFGTPVPALPWAIVGFDRKLESVDKVLDSKLVSALGTSHTLSVGGQVIDSEMTDGLADKDFSQTMWSVFAEDEWRLRDDLALTLGARYDDHDAFGGQISPRAYLVWNTTDSWTLKGGISRGYKAPDLQDVHDGVNGVGAQGNAVTVGNPNLKPEKSTNTEFGVYYDNFLGFNANATLFHNRFKDKIVTADNRVFTPAVCLDNRNVSGAPDPGCTLQINVDEAVTQGAELAARWQFAPAWAVSTSYTYTDSEQKSGANKGRPFVNTPEHLVYARLDWATTDRLGLWLRGEYRGDRTRFLDSYENLSAANRTAYDQVGDLQAYEVFHLGGTLRATDKLTLHAAIYNLLDKDFTKGTYYTTNGTNAWASDYIQTGRSTDGTLEEGRRLWLSATMDF